MAELRERLSKLDLSKATPEELAVIKSALEAESLGGSFRDFIVASRPDFIIYDHCELVIDLLQQLHDDTLGKDNLMVCLPPRHNLPVDTPVLTTKGWKAHGDLGPGDYVFGADGHPQRVIQSVWHFDAPVSKLTTFWGDTEIVAGDEHRWSVYDRGSRVTRETRELYSSTAARFQLPPSPVLKGDGRIPNPYTFGAWLGDGYTGDYAICGNPEDLATIIREIESEGVVTYLSTIHPQTGVETHRLLGADLGDRTKRIPEEFFVACETDRRALLQGLVDTGGSVELNTGRVRFRQACPDLAKDVALLVKTLGYDSYTDCTSKGSYCVQWSPHDGHIPGRLARKAIPGTCTYRRVGLRNPKPCGTTHTNCITVEGDGSYLAGTDLIPTLNSKSMLSTLLYPAYYIHNNPDKNVILTACTADLARNKFSVELREFMQQPPIELEMGATSGKDIWRTKAGGSILAAGAGGTIIGFGGHLIVIDDPVRDRESATSPILQQKIYDWYRSVADTRTEPGCKKLLIMQRWHDLDLAGRILETEGDDWHLLELPAIAKDDDPLGRKKGEALCPSRYPIEVLETKRRTMGNVFFESMYQQSPIPEGGLMFRADQAKYYERIDERTFSLDGSIVSLDDCVEYLTADMAHSESSTADYSAIGHYAATPQGDLLVLHMWRRRLSATKFEQLVVDITDRQRYIRFVVVERTQASISTIEELRKHHAIKDPKPMTGKAVRAVPAQVLQERGKLWYPDPDSQNPVDSWVVDFEDELYRFPGGKHDDQVDTLSLAVEYIRESKGSKTELTLNEYEPRHLVRSRLFPWMDY